MSEPIISSQRASLQDAGWGQGAAPALRVSGPGTPSLSPPVVHGQRRRAVSSSGDDEAPLSTGAHADADGVSQPGAAAATGAPFKTTAQRKHGRARSGGSDSSNGRTAARIVAQDAAMLLAQLLFFINHVRRLLDACACERQPDLHIPLAGALASYPCAAPLRGRITFLLTQPADMLRTVLQLPPGELWVPLVTGIMLAQAAALALLPRRLYLRGPRWACLPLVGLLPKAASLASFLAFPGARPSSYFDTYLPLEGVITLWQQAVYNYPFWPGVFVLLAHCALTTTICLLVGAAAAGQQLFSAPWVLVQAYACALLAAVVSRLQQPSRGAALSGQGPAALAGNKQLQHAGEAGAADGGPAALQRWGSGTAATSPVADDAPPAAQLEDASPAASRRGSLTQIGSALMHKLARALGSQSGLVGAEPCNGACGCSRSRTRSPRGVGSLTSSLVSSTLTSEAPSAAGSGSHTAAVSLAKATGANAVAAAAAAAAAAAVEAATPRAGSSRASISASTRSSSSSRPSSTEAALAMLAAQASVPVQYPAAAPRPAPAPMPVHPVPPVQPVQPVAPIYQPQPPVSIAAAATAVAAARAAKAAAKERKAALMPPAVGAFSLKQPTGLSKWTIVEDREFQAPAPPSTDLAMASSLDAINRLSARSGRFARYRSRAPMQRVHMKVPWAEPEQLPGNFLERLNMALSEGVDVMAVGVAARAGCIELVFDVVPRPGTYDSTAELTPADRTARAQLLLQAVDATDVAAEQQQQQQQWWGQGHGQSLALMDSHSTLEEAVLSGLLSDADPSSWVETLHLQPPPDSEVLTQACGRVWVSRWDAANRQWVPERVGGIRPSELPRITAVEPPCILHAHPQQHRGGSVRPPAASLSVTVSNAESAPAFSARCRGRYLPVVQHQPLRSLAAGGAGAAAAAASGASESGGSAAGGSASRLARLAADTLAAAAAEGGEDAAAAAAAAAVPGPAVAQVELPAGLPRNGLVIVECKVGKLLSNWRPIMVTDDPALAAEVATLFPGTSGGSAAAAASGEAAASVDNDEADQVTCDDLLTDLGLWLDYIEVLGLTGSTTAAATPMDSGAHLDGAVLDAAAAAADGPGAPGGALINSGNLPAAVAQAVQAAHAAVAAAEAAAAAGSGGSATLPTHLPALSGAAGAAAAVGPLARQPGSLDFGSGLAALYGTPCYRSHMAGIAVTLLEFAVDRGWTHTASMLVGQLLASGVAWDEVLGRCSGGLTLLHRAVRSGHPDMVALVVALGEAHGTPFDWQAATVDQGHGGLGSGVEGVTPLHLAAALPDGGRLAERILSEYQAACELWSVAQDSHGMRPLDCARASGHVHLVATGTGGTTWGRAATAAAAANTGDVRRAAAAPGPAPAPTPAATGAGDRCPPSVAAAAMAAGGAAAISTDGSTDGSSAGTSNDSNAFSDVSSSAVPSSTTTRMPTGAATTGNAGGTLAGTTPLGSPTPFARTSSGEAAAAAAGGGSSAAAAPAAAAVVVAARQGDGGGGGGLVGLLRELPAALRAPWVNDSESERRYLTAVGAAYVTWSCCYLVYQMSMVSGVAGRMVKETRAHEMTGMLIFFTPHVISAALLCINYAAWLRRREGLAVAVTLTRSSAKLLPVLGLLPYPHSSAKYMTWAMDVVLEGVVPAFFEQMRGPLALAVRAVEGVATGLLYHRLGVVASLPGALAYALAWTLGSGLLTALLDVRHRALMARGRLRPDMPAAATAAAAAAAAASVAPAGRESDGSSAGLPAKKID
ncbi:hypothetical protein HYH02_008356 [Chlamydomonas schloesseri]|uniref:Uncharacterized protein n=1 Tax=Chlamydomonas schloesseri TaxID=2026947 RepID=A0A836B3P9_9CHLO|nr:hypothetical protein HYH02_008356 [Chlamydomonas schloesseri]|eukprot:KAG2446796.1 hypothetical protein HYH02_008356 [Chlamydomonas schloesseri]